MAKCKTCSGEVGAMDIGNIKFALIASAVAGSLVADQANKMVTKNPDGTPKTTGYLVENPKVKDGLYVAGGALATMMADGNEWITGLGVGIAIYGGYNLVKSMMAPAGTAGIGYIPPGNMAGLPYMQPNNIAANPVQEQQMQFLMQSMQELKKMNENKMPVMQGIRVQAGL